MSKAPVVDNTSGAAITDVLSGKTFWGLRSDAWGPVTGNVAAGANVTGTALIMTIPNGLYSGSKTATATSSALLAENIKSGTTIFGVLGTYGGSALVPRTGQILCYDPSGSTTSQTACAGTGQDGDTLLKGVTWPSPRFTSNSTDTVIDNLTGLMWAKDASTAGTKSWAAALTYCNELAIGGYSDWRLPNVREFHSLMDYGKSVAPLLPADHLFTNVANDYYWSSTTNAVYTDNAWDVSLGLGYVSHDVKSRPRYVWPVRGGQS
jgi:hypothetical protein